MTTYNTYAEAKLVKGCVDVYRDMYGKFLPYCGGFEVPAGNICNPADHCMSLDAFFEAGHKFEDGDCYLNWHGVFKKVGNNVDMECANTRIKDDSRFFVLSAKALEEKVELSAEDVPEGATHYCDGTFVMMNDSSSGHGWCKVWFEGKWHKNAPIANCVRIEELIKKDLAKEPEQVEWKIGDKCVFQGRDCVFVNSNPVAESAIIVDAKGVPAMSVPFHELSKPETPEQKEEREIEKLAKQASIDCYGTGAEFLNHDMEDAIYSMIRAGYRKPE